MSDWTECRIGDVVSLQQGLCINSKSKHLLADEGYPLLRITDLINDSEVQFINRHKVQEKFLATKSSLIYTRTGQVGLVFRGKKGVVHNNCFTIEPGNEIDINYLYWFLKSSFAYEYANSVASGAAQPDLGHTPFKSMYIRYPKKDNQQKIAAILSAYDDLIENNKRRIALLENMAEEIYREWFVRFRFPGYQTAEFEKGIPKGWEIRPIGFICKKVTDGSHASPAYLEGGKYMASVKDMNNHGFDKKSMKTISEQDYESLARGDCQPQESDILIAKDGSYLKHVFVWRDKYDVVLLSSIAILRPDLNKILPFFFSMLLRQPSTKTMMSGYVSGSALPRIILSDFKKMNILIPSHPIMNAYENMVSPIFQEIKNLELEIENLSTTKEMLLPRLISGKLSVGDLDIQFPSIMQETLHD